MMSKQKGLGVDNLLALTVALTNGTIVEADEAGEHSELFWCAGRPRVGGRVGGRLCGSTQAA